MTRAATEEFDPDQPIVAAVLQGNRYAFEELSRRHGDWVRGVIYGVLGDRDRVDDVSQQVWVTAWQNIGKLRNPERWRPWLYRLARNAAVDAGRDRARRRRTAEQLSAEPPRRVATMDSGESADGAERREAVTRAIRGLPALYREPLVLKHMEGWSYRRIGEVMGLPVDTVETRLVRARRLLREALEGKV